MRPTPTMPMRSAIFLSSPAASAAAEWAAALADVVRRAQQPPCGCAPTLDQAAPPSHSALETLGPQRRDGIQCKEFYSAGSPAHTLARAGGASPRRSDANRCEGPMHGIG